MKKKPTIQNHSICKNCYWFKPAPAKGMGECKYNPPQVVSVDEDGFITVAWPVVGEQELSCGQFSQGPRVVN